MPKILINEKDRTNPGAASGYSNYSVLIPGFMANDPSGAKEANKIQPDSNNVYEFSSAQDFKDTIGLVAPAFKKSSDAVEAFHYGNQMAYELLNLGYSIVYLPIKPENCIETLKDAKTWEIFKDKASYDFRFITHGLLESSDIAKQEAEKEGLVSALQALFNKDIIEGFDQETLTVQINDSAISISKLTNEQIDSISVSDDEDAYADFVDDEYFINPESGSSYSDAATAVKGLLTRLRTTINSIDGQVTEAAINTVNTNIANLAKYVTDETEGLPGRGDCIALIELDENAYVDHNPNPELAIITAINQLSGIDKDNGKYCAATVPSVVYSITDYDMDPTRDGKKLFDNNKKFPGAFHYLACFMNSLRSGFAEWYAAAGYTRGVSSYRIDHTTVTLGEIAINALEPRNTDNSDSSPKFACNVIANFRGSYYLWGNRTAHPLGDAKGADGDLVASHFLNIRHLCTTIKKQLYAACRRFTFDPNSDTLWFNFINAIRPTLDNMKADQGIRDYKILKVYTDKKATLKAKIRIVPIEAVEDFDLEVSLEDSFGETAAVVTE